MTIEELDKQINIDRKLLLTEQSSLMLSEGFDKKTLKKHGKKIINTAGNAKDVIKDHASKDIKVTKRLVDKHLRNMKEKNNKFLLSGDTSEIKFVSKALIKFSALAALTNPFLAVIGFITSNTIKKGTNNNKRYDLYKTYEAEKASVDAKIERLKKKDDEEGLREDEEKQLYQLIKLSKKYELDSKQLKANILHNDSVINARKNGKLSGFKYHY